MFSESVACPHLLPPKAALTLKMLMQHQPWREEYKLSLEETEQNADICQVVNEQMKVIDR